MIIKQHTCLGSKDVYLFYKHKKDKWIKKYKDWYKEYSQYLALNANYGKMYTKFDADLAALEAKANEQDEEKFPCKAKVSEITGVWTSIKEKDKEVEALREETQAIRFEVETITHRLKH